MRPIARSVLILGILLYSCGCGQKSAKLQKSVVPPDKTLFERGYDYYQKSQYIKARLAFQTLLSTYPDSDMAAEAHFAMGDTFYEEGGTENLLLAEGQYKNFQVFFPGNPRGAEAQMKIISLNYKMRRSPDRDQQFSERTLEEIKRLLKQYPDSDYVPIAEQIQRDVEEDLARSNFLVGMFYADRGNYAGAIGRFDEVVDEYPAYSNMDEVYFQLGKAWGNHNDKKIASEKSTYYYSKIAAGYPFSKIFDKAKEQLKMLGKEVPPVDTELAAVNQSRVRKDEGFSPLKPLIDFGKALGLVSQRDLYGEAQKAIEAEKIKSAEAIPNADESSETPDNIQIETIIRKDASGATRDTTKLGGGSASAPQSSLEKSNKKNSDNKKKKKNYNKKPS